MSFCLLLLLNLLLYLLPSFLHALHVVETSPDTSSSSVRGGVNSNTPKAWMVPKDVKFSTLDKLKLLPIESLDNNDDDNYQRKKASSEPKVLIATKAVGLNFADIFTVLGLYSAANEVRNHSKDENNNKVKRRRKNRKELSPFIPGLEFSGIVLEDQTGQYKKGDKVLGFSRFGAYSDIVQVPPAFLKKLPSHWTFPQGASFIVQALTAWHGLVEIGRMPLLTENEIKTKDRPYVVIVHSAAGGVGLWAAEIAARRGAIVIGIVGNHAKKEVFYNRIKEFSPLSRSMIRGQERDFGIRLAQMLHNVHSSYNNDEDNNSVLEQGTFDNDLKKIAKNGYGADIVMESLGGQYFQNSFDSLNSGGALVTFGSTSYVSPGLGLNLFRLMYRYVTRPKIDPGDLTSRNIRLCGFNLIYLTESQVELRRQLNECIACLSGITSSKGKMSQDSFILDDDDIPLDNVTPPMIGNVFDFRMEAVNAMEKLKGGSTVGKVVLDNSNNPCQ